MRLTPDPRLMRKWMMVMATVTVMTMVMAVIAQVLVWSFAEPPDAGLAGTLVWTITGGLLLAMWIVSVPICRMWIDNLSYELETDKIVIRKGILSKIQQNIPYRMVTDFRLHRSPFDRLLGIGSIDIQTAGQSGQAATAFEGRLLGLADWETLHGDLRSRIGTPVGPDITPDDLTVIRREVEAIHHLLERQV